MKTSKDNFSAVFGNDRGTSSLAVGIKTVVPRLLVTYRNVLDHHQGRVKKDLQLHSHQIFLTTKAKRELHKYHDRTLLLPYEGDELLKALVFPTAKKPTKEKFEFGESELRLTNKRNPDTILIWYLKTKHEYLNIHLTGERLMQIRAYLQAPNAEKVAVIKKFKSVGI